MYDATNIVARMTYTVSDNQFSTTQCAGVIIAIIVLSLLFLFFIIYYFLIIIIIIIIIITSIYTAQQASCAMSA